jgi:hypothetical protein
MTQTLAGDFNYKNGAWHDVAIAQRDLVPPTSDPPIEPR